mgnify:FL=1
MTADRPSTARSTKRGATITNNLTSDGITGYGYDVENRLVSVNRAGMTAGYTYDVLGRRHSKTVNGVTTVYLHDGDREIAELDSGGAILRRYVHAAGLDEVVAAIEADGTRRFLHRDTLGSVVAVTDAGGAVVERHAYGPFGESAVLTGTPWRFAGQRLDPESGLYYMRGRHYSPALGRFVQPDPIGYEGGLNLYAYVNNDPLNLSDPMGTEPQKGMFASILETAQNAVAAAAQFVVEHRNVLAGAAMVAVGGAMMAAGFGAGPGVALAGAGVATVNTAAVATAATGAVVAAAGAQVLMNEANRGMPKEGEPNSWAEHPQGKQLRKFDADGKPQADIDLGHAHKGHAPHVHNWENGVRGDGLPVSLIPKK